MLEIVIAKELVGNAYHVASAPRNDVMIGESVDGGDCGDRK